MQQILQSYLRRLTNLTGNNRSLLLLKLIGEQFIDIFDFEYVNKKPSFSIIEQLIAQKPKINLVRSFDSRDKHVNMLSQRLKRLQRTERFIFEERGSKDLYVGWPFVRGKFSDGTLISCPLIFFPVELAEENNDWVLKLREDVYISLNKSFLLAYAYYNKVKIEESLIEKVFDDFDKDSRIFRTALYQLFKESPVEINFNQENFIDKLEAFTTLTKKEALEKEREGELKLFPEAVLGIFPQAGSYLVPDYLTLIENGNFEDIEQFFESRSQEEDKKAVTLRPSQNNFLQKVKEEQVFTPFKMDASQENALKAVKRGNSVVVHGPPGTGKSQLICNLISDFIARGKRVLVVCQKRAALDVVYKRMKEHEAQEFIALVHDFKNDRNSIFKQIANQIERLYEYKLKNNSLDAIQMERKFQQASRKIDQITETLEELKYALFDQSECGLSIKELYLTSDLNAPSVNLKHEYRYFHFDNLEDFISKFKYFLLYNARFQAPKYPWKNRVSFKEHTITDFQNIQDILQEIPDYQKKISKLTREIVQGGMDFIACEEFLNNESKILEFNVLLANDTVYEYFSFMQEAAEKHMDQLWLSNMERVLLDCFKGEGPEASLASEDLGEFQEVLQEVLEARRNFFKWAWWRYFSRKRYVFKRVMQANKLKLNRKGLSILIQKVDNRLNLEHNIAKLKNVKWLKNVPHSYNKIDYQTWFYQQKKALLAALIFNSVKGLKEHFTSHALSNTELTNKVERMLHVAKDIPSKKQEWLTYLSPNQLYAIIEDESYADTLSQTLKNDFEDLCDFDSLSDKLAPHETKLIEKILDEVKSSNIEAAEQLLQNSLRLAWIEHIEIKYPVLRSVTSLKFRELEKELQEAVKEKLDVSKDILLLKARERTYHDVEFNRLNNMVTYRDLQHQVTKKKRIWPIRKLVGEFEEELFNLVPCWLASPESVSAIFPMKQIFDLVIFDEASQCFAERGIPAMYRGRQIVITGDDKQLSPNDLYQIRWEEEEEAADGKDLALEADSLLDLGLQHLMQVQLQEHYRSKSLSLIDFSNRHFYNDTLKLLPDYFDINNDEPAISYIRVEGTWENNANKTEAEQVVKLIKELAYEKPRRTVGVVTFNITQQNEIADLIDQEQAKGVTLWPEDLFVKNIENIQGDERDIIIFSTAYGPDAKGKISMNFGSLNMPKGANRLNVAITRAKEKIYIVSSIWPDALKVEASKNDGPKLLKQYLQFALEVSQGKYVPKAHENGDYNGTWYLKDKISAVITKNHKRFQVTHELPFADITIKQNDRYQGLLMTDDQLYHQAISIKDPHVYTPFTLHHKKWKFRGFFSREYWRNREQVEEQLLRFMAQIDSENKD